MNAKWTSKRVLYRTADVLFGGTMAAIVTIGAFPELARMAADDGITLYNVRAGDPVAVKGYDVVEYFRSGKAVKGRKDLAIKHRGIVYRFSNEDNLKNFEMDPDAYLPAHGGWCSSAMAFGRKVDINPDSFIVENGRLFLFYKGIRGDGKKDWLANQPQWLYDADAQWEKISGEKAPNRSN